MQAKRLNLDGSDRNERSERKRKSRFGDDDELIPEKTLLPMVYNYYIQNLHLILFSPLHSGNTCRKSIVYHT